MRILRLFSFLFAMSLVASAQDPVKVDPTRYRVLFENAHMRVLEERDKPGDKIPMHSHPAYMTYVTGSGKTKITLPDGESSIEEASGSKFDCRPATQHATENVGNTPKQELLVEFKDATNPCSTTQASAFSTSQIMPRPYFSSSEDVSALKQLEQDWLDSYREGDADKMSKILADDFIGRWADGSTQTKEQQLKAIRTGQEKHSSNHLDECNVRIYATQPS